MKIALLGSEPSSLAKAPFQNSKTKEWAEGKVPSTAKQHGQVDGDWEMWACSPGCWAAAPRITRFFEVHRMEPGQPWFSPEYLQFLRTFNGPIYTGGRTPEIPHGIIYPIDRMEEKFSSYFFTSSLALMLALAIDTIEQVRAARASVRALRDAAATGGAMPRITAPPEGMDPAELELTDAEDIIGLWGVDMAAGEEWGYQRPGCQFFILEAMRRGIGVYLPPESDLMRPMPVYGISEWDHNYIKLTAKSRRLNSMAQQAQTDIANATAMLQTVRGEMQAVDQFVNTWTNPYGMQHGLIIRHEPGTGLGSGITHVDTRTVERMVLREPAPGSITIVDPAELGQPSG